MDRRSFLRMFSAASAVSLVSGSGLTKMLNRGLDLPGWGLYLEEPIGWTRMTAPEMVALRGQQTWAEGSAYATEEIAQPTPVLAFSRYPEPTPRMNPTILVFADRLPAEQAFEPLPAIRYFESDYSENVHGYRLLAEPTMAAFGNVVAARSKATFLIEESNGFAEQVARRSAIAVHRDLGFLVMMTDSLQGNEKAEAEFTDFERSLRFYET